VADSVGRHLKTVLQKRNQPAAENHKKHRFVFEFQMAVPGKGHKDIGDSQQQNGFHNRVPVFRVFLYLRRERIISKKEVWLSIVFFRKIKYVWFADG